MWAQPLKGQTSDGKVVNIIVIDSEGIGALYEDASHDIKVFTLAILLSSCFIYNSVGNIDENALANLGLVVNLSKHIQIKANEEEVDEEEYSKIFPSFVWVVRDFTL